MALKFTSAQFARLAREPEGQRLELKRELDLSEKGKHEFAKDCQGFANTEGGLILVGVAESPKKIVGISTALGREQLIQSARARSSPPVDIEVHSVRRKDGQYLGLVFVPKGKAVYVSKTDDKVYVRRGPITVPATPAEIAHLQVERNRVNLTRLQEPLRPVVEDNRIVLLPHTLVPYRKIRKKGYLWPTAQCPVFLPEFSTHISPPRFGGSGSPINAGYHSVRTLTVVDFARRVKEVEETVLSMGTYFDALSRFYCSISDDSSLAYGCGVENFLKATKDGCSGVASFVNCGEFRGSPSKASFILLASSYLKGPPGFAVATYPTIDLYMSFIPVSVDLIETLFRPFIDEERLPLHSMSYEPANAELKVWAPKTVPKESPKITGVIRRLKYRRNWEYEIGGVIAGSDWYSDQYYSFKREMTPPRFSRFFDPWQSKFGIEPYSANQSPIELLDEVVIALTNPVPFFEDIKQGSPTGVDSFTLPYVRQFTVEGYGHTVHILGINGGPDARTGRFSRQQMEEELEKIQEMSSRLNDTGPLNLPKETTIRRTVEKTSTGKPTVSLS